MTRWPTYDRQCNQITIELWNSLRKDVNYCVMRAVVTETCTLGAYWEGVDPDSILTVAVVDGKIGGDVRELTPPKIFAVCICIPPFLHRELVGRYATERECLIAVEEFGKAIRELEARVNARLSSVAAVDALRGKVT